MAAVVKLTDASYAWPLAAGTLGPPQAGTTYGSGTGQNGTWWDTNVAGSYDGGIRVRTSDYTSGGTPTATPTRTSTSTATSTSSNTPMETATPIGGPEVTVTLQQGVDSYAGCDDTFLYLYAPSTNCGWNDKVMVGYKQQYVGLLRFDLSSIPAARR